jgi:hypothetical protein
MQFIYYGRLFVCHIEISKTTTPLVTLLMPLESLQWIGVHQGGCVMFRPTMQKLLNIEQNFQKNQQNQDWMF